MKRVALIALLLGMIAGCGSAPDDKEKAEAARVAQEVRDYANRIISEAERKRKTNNVAGSIPKTPIGWHAVHSRCLPVGGGC